MDLLLAAWCVRASVVFVGLALVWVARLGLLLWVARMRRRWMKCLPKSRLVLFFDFHGCAWLNDGALARWMPVGSEICVGW